MKKLFHERSEIGHFSGNKRDFENEYSMTEPEDNPNDAQDWMEKGKDPEIQKKWDSEWEKIKKNPNAWQGNRYYSGHSHIDLAWLWRYLQTTDKVRVTFSKACFHIKNIPEYTFSGSQSILYDWVRIRHPKLWKELKIAIKTGRFELVGGSWCEPDTHMPSGEAWVRQRLYGQLFYWKHFGKYATVDWVPDSFGFTNSIPQIMLKSNTPRFLTGKLNENDSTQFPFSTFWWESPDGSRVLAETLIGNPNDWEKTGPSHRLLKTDTQSSTPAFTYESGDSDTHENISEEYNPYLYRLYGKGDGGHGPTGEEVQRMIYNHRKGRINLISAEEYFDLVENTIGERLPVWKDELYLEYHRGTLTSIGLVKRMNRFNEWHLPALETLCILASNGLNYKDFDYPYEILDEAWKMTLFQQFHDVLPGTCIVETYDDAWDIWIWQVEEYQKIQSAAFGSISNSLNIERITPNSVRSLIKAGIKVKPILIFNPTSFKLNGKIEIPLPSLNQLDFRPEYIVDSSDNNYSLIKSSGLKCFNDNLYEIPDRYIFIGSLDPLSLGIFFLVERSEIDTDEDNKIKDLKHSESDSSIEISNNILSANFDKSTGAIDSLKIYNGEEWLESIQQDNKAFNPTSKPLLPGIRIESFKELAKDFPAWNMWKESRKFPYISKVISVEIDSITKNSITVKTVIDYPTPNPEIQNVSSEDLIYDESQNTEEKILVEKSTVKSYFTLFIDDPMLYLDIDIDFNSKKTLFKLDIPTITNAKRIDVETAYAIDNRSTIPKTPRDKARWENHMHTWVNLQSEDNNWGFAVINNGKYGIDYHKGYLGISILHGQSYFPPRYIAWVFEERFEREDEQGGYPPSWIDQGQHIISLALYPHKGDLIEAQVIQKAHQFNSPPLCHSISNNQEQTKIIITIDALNFTPQCNYPLEISTLKRAHLDGEALGWKSENKNIKRVLIMRVVNQSNSKIENSIDISKMDVVDVRESDLLERQIQTKETQFIKENDKIIKIISKWNPFEIKSFGILLN